ncbi:MAG: ribonuclease H-like domain-containing protein [Planctomycetota bacterium]|nr:ribonuclease H-like domain-containing protein [Planctomycetota bacterium]
MNSRLRQRLRRIARDGARSREPGAARTAGSPGGAAEATLREPRREGRLLVWRERLDGGEAGEPDPVSPDLPLTVSRCDSRFAEISDSRLAAVYGRAGIDADRLAFVDIETCGLADVPVFLVGVLRRDGPTWELTQYLAVDPSGEPELLRRTAAVLARHDDWVSFNGRSFDVPRILRRSRLHGVDWPVARSHRDLLHDVRRRWKNELPNCRLGTVERCLLGLERPPTEVPGREVPERYYDFVQRGERRWIDPVVEHNRRDVVALAILLARIVGARDGS